MKLNGSQVIMLSFMVICISCIHTLARPCGYGNLSNHVLLQITLYGDNNFPNELNRSILKLTIRFKVSTGRFE